jgi:hypothetical protein
MNTGEALGIVFFSLCVAAATRSTWWFSASMSGLMLVSHWARESRNAQQ